MSKSAKTHHLMRKITARLQGPAADRTPTGLSSKVTACASHGSPSTISRIALVSSPGRLSQRYSRLETKRSSWKSSSIWTLKTLAIILTDLEALSSSSRTLTTVTSSAARAAQTRTRILSVNWPKATKIISGQTTAYVQINCRVHKCSIACEKNGLYLGCYLNSPYTPKVLVHKKTIWALKKASRTRMKGSGRRAGRLAVRIWSMLALLKKLVPPKTWYLRICSRRSIPCSWILAPRNSSQFWRPFNGSLSHWMRII